jgi:hypothetical protein
LLDNFNPVKVVTHSDREPAFNVAEMSSRRDLLLMYEGQIVPRSFNAGFVTLSFVVSLIGAASTLELINRRTAPKGTFNQYEENPPEARTQVLTCEQFAFDRLCGDYGWNCNLVHGKMVSSNGLGEPG